MSSMICFASDSPLPERPNPHYKTLSVNEALAMGMEDIPAQMLEEGYDRDEPGVLLWSDTKIVFDPEKNTVDDGDLEDDYAIWRTEKPPELQTEKKYCAYLEWVRYTPGRAGRVIRYLKEHLRTAGEVELWIIWQDGGSAHLTRKVRVEIDMLTAEDIEELEKKEVWKEPVTHYCYLLTRSLPC